MKKIFVRLLALLLVCTCTVGIANATVDASSLISERDAFLMVSGKTITVCFETVGTKIMDEIGVSSISVQYYSGGDWLTVKTFDLSNSTGLTALNTHYHGGTKSYYASSSGIYRAVVEIYARLNDQTDSRTMITATVIV